MVNGERRPGLIYLTFQAIGSTLAPNMGNEGENRASERSEIPFEYCMLQFVDVASSDIRNYIVNPRVVLSAPKELLKLKQDQKKVYPDRHPLGTEYYEKFISKARGQNGSFGLIDAIEVLTEDGWEPTQTVRANRYDTFMLFRRSK